MENDSKVSAAIATLESVIHDEYDGTSLLAENLAHIEVVRAAPAQNTQGEAVKKWPTACDWPDEPFTVKDEPGEHDPCWLVMPGNSGMLAFVHHAINGVDQARAQFVADACNAYLHADRATVPAKTEMDYEYDEEGLLDTYCTGHMDGWNDCLKAIATPSQPKDAQS